MANNNISKHLKNNKVGTKKQHKSGISKLNCGTYSKVYVGQTCRNLERRRKEQFLCFVTNNLLIIIIFNETVDTICTKHLTEGNYSDRIKFVTYNIMEIESQNQHF